MNDINKMQQLIAQAATGAPLEEDAAAQAFEIIMSGGATPAQMGAFIMALRVRGETVAEITAAARAMRKRALAVATPPDALDTCGTGGDGAGTWNVSTGAALVAAAAGVPVAKHGNRALSSRSGSAEVLRVLGVNLDIPPDRIAACISAAGLGFMFAPLHHDAMKHAGPVRRELGIRTIFNLLGPLCNPGGVTRQLVGVFDGRWVEPLARALRNLGARRVWVVHGADGLDELTTTGPSRVAELRNGNVRTFTVSPADAGLACARAQDLKGADPAHNAAALSALLDGETGAYRDIVLLNAAAALCVGGRTQGTGAAALREGVEMARQAIDSGGARRVLERLIAVSNATGPDDSGTDNSGTRDSGARDSGTRDSGAHDSGARDSGGGSSSQAADLA